MQLKKIVIQNFRGLREVNIDLDTITVLIGENNSGKTSILEAIRLCLARTLSRRGPAFEDYDYHLPSKDAQPGEIGPLSLTFQFVEEQPNHWKEEIIQALGDDVIIFLGELRAVILRVTSALDQTTREFVTDWEFLNAAGKPLSAKTKRPQVLATLQQFCPVFYLTASRDAVKDFGSRAPFWAPFLRNPNIPPQLRTDLENELSTLNAKIIDAHKSLKEVSKNLQKAGNVVPLGEKQAVTIEALPAKAFDALSRAQVSLTGTTGAMLPLIRHGAGTQSLSVMFLFESFLDEMLEQTFDPSSEPILTLEEPEAHLHPSAIRTLWRSLKGMKGQKIIATHSGDLLAEVPLMSIRRLCRKNGAIEVRRVGPITLGQEDQRKLEFHIRYSRGELFFARCWVLVEGETEHHILQGIAELMGEDYDLERHGVRIVPARHVGISTLLRVADDLGIAWHCLADSDSQGQSDGQVAAQALAGRPTVEHVTLLPANNIELYLCKKGFGEVYEKHISQQKRGDVTASPGTEDYWRQVIKAKDDTPKPSLAIEVLEVMRSKGIGSAPSELNGVIETVIKLAKQQQ